MKKRFGKYLLTGIALALTATALTACQTVPSDTPTDPTATPDVSPTEDLTPTPSPVNEREIVLKTKEATLVMEAKDDGLFIRSLATERAGEAMNGESSFALPKRIQTEGKKYTLNWTFVRWNAVKGNENGTAYEGAEIVYACSERKLQTTVTVLIRPSLAGPFEFRTVVENEGMDDVKFLPGTFSSITVKAGGNLISVKKESGASEGYRHYDGTYFAGSGIYSTQATDGASVTAWVNTLQNFNASGYLPMIYQDKGDSGVYCALEWSAGRVLAKGYPKGITFSVDMDGVSESGGDFATLLPGLESFALPSVYIGAYDGTLDEGSNGFKHWFFTCKAPAALRDNANEPLSQMDMQTGLNAHGIESIKWDYGWWSNDRLGGWKSLEGSWVLRNKDYIGVLNGYNCTTMAEFGEAAKDRGLNWTAYVLLHDTLAANGKATDEFSDFNSLTNPEWFSNRCIAGGMGCSADLGNEDCVAYLQEALAAFFGDNNVGTWRSDFEPICYSSDKTNRHYANGSDVMYWCSVGFRDIVDYLYENVKGFRYESCSSGGSMKDLFTATLAVSINTDDVANYMGMRATFYDSSYVIHPSQLQFPCNSDFFNPNCSTFWPKVTTSGMDPYDFEEAMLDMGFRSQCLGSPMFSSWTCTCMTDYYEEYSEMYATKMRPLIRDGELYHILPRPDGVNYDGVMYADPDSANEIKGLVYLFKPSEKPGNTCHLTLQGLDPAKTYRLSFEDRVEQNCVKTGAELMSEGIDVEILYVGSELIWITEKN